MLLFYINSILMFYPKICFRKQDRANTSKIVSANIRSSFLVKRGREMSLLIIFIAPTFIVDKGIYQRSNINGFVLSFFLFRANCLGETRNRMTLIANQLMAIDCTTRDWSTLTTLITL